MLAGNEVISPEVDDTTIANIVISFATDKIQMSYDDVETSTATLQPYFDDLNIHHQRHQFIDVPLILEARDALATANYLLNIARYRLDAIRAVVAPGLLWDLDNMLYMCLGVHAVIHLIEAQNRDIMHLFRRVARPNRNVFRNTFGSQLGSNTWRWPRHFCAYYWPSASISQSALAQSG